MKKNFWPPVLWLVFVTALSMAPGIQLPKFELFAADKLAHAVVYGVLVWLLLRAFSRERGGGAVSARLGFFIFVFAAAWGTLMEWVQGTFFPSRFFELDDMIANTFGAAVAWGGWVLRSRKPPF